MRPARALAALTLALAGCPAVAPPPPPPPEVVVLTPADAGFGLDRARADLVADLGRMGATVREAPLPDTGCVDGEVHLLALGDAHDETGAAASSGLDPQSYRLTETRCGESGRRIVLRGGSPLAGQWAVYDLLERLGVRYWHPEQTFYPDAVTWWRGDPLDVTASPDVVDRSMHAHRTHPIELSAPLDDTGLDMAAYQQRWIDWNVKARQTTVDGWDAAYVGDYAYARGFPRTAGFNLLNSQQGGRPILDPDDPRPEEDQIAEALEAALAPRDGLPDVTRFNFQFNPSEFTEADDQATVRRLTFIADYMAEHHPDVALFTINHGTHQGPTPTYGVRFFDLPELAPGNLGVQVHTLMFYDLERPAPVYGNTDFSHLLDWSLTQQAERRIVHYPESSWWLTFDLPVPLYLAPVTVEARHHDLDLLSGHLSSSAADETGIWGHHLFTSGQEWGYWLIDWCTARMAWDVSFTDDDCLADLTGRFAQGGELLSVLRAVRDRQVEDLRDPELLRFLVGSDDETEVAATVGIDFHPLPPAPAEVLGWDDAKVAALETESLVPLEAMAADYHAFAARVAATLPAQGEAAAPWVREVRDGLEIFALRAEHAARVYRTVLALRSALAAGDLGAVAEAAAGVDAARALTDQAGEVVRRREAEYRYPPELTVAGGEPDTPEAVPNKTIYPYRYLSRTHRMFYWHRPDDQLAALFGEGLEVVQVGARVLRADTDLEVGLVADGVSELRMDWGDGTVADAVGAHPYPAEGFYDWTLDATTASGLVHHEDRVAVAARRLVFAKGSLKVEAPAGAEIVQALLPGFVVGLGDDGAPFMALGRLDGSAELAAQGSLLRRDRAGATSGPADLALSLKDVGALVVHDAVLTVDDGTGPEDRRLVIEGEMATQDVVDLLVSVGGFEEEGAKKLVAALLDYTPETLPARLAFRIAATGHE